MNIIEHLFNQYTISSVHCTSVHSSRNVIDILKYIQFEGEKNQQFNYPVLGYFQFSCQFSFCTHKFSFASTIPPTQD